MERGTKRWALGLYIMGCSFTSNPPRPDSCRRATVRDVRVFKHALNAFRTIFGSTTPMPTKTLYYTTWIRERVVPRARAREADATGMGGQGYGTVEETDGGRNVAKLNTSVSFMRRVSSTGLALMLVAAVLAVACAGYFKSISRGNDSMSTLKAPALELKERSKLAAESSSGTNVYLGNGCFWARQHAFVQVEQKSASFDTRSDVQVVCDSPRASASSRNCM